MYKSEFLKIIRSKRSIFIIILIFLIPFIDLLFNWHSTFFDYLLHPEAYKGDLSREYILHPAKASFLSGSSIGHISQMLLIWILPLYILLGYSDITISEYNSGYLNIIYTKIERKKYIKVKLIFSFIFYFLVYFLSLLLNFFVAYVVFGQGMSFSGLESYENNHMLLAFSIKYPYIAYFIYILVFSLIAGTYSLVCTFLSFMFHNKKIVYSLSFFVWLIQILLPYSLTYIMQPFIEYDLSYIMKSLAQYLVILLTVFFSGHLLNKVKKDEL